MNRFMFYLDSFLGTVGKGISYITHHGQYKIKDTVTRYQHKTLTKNRSSKGRR